MGVAIARMIPCLFLFEVYELAGRNSYKVDVKDLFPSQLLKTLGKQDLEFACITGTKVNPIFQQRKTIRFPNFNHLSK